MKNRHKIVLCMMCLSFILGPYVSCGSSGCNIAEDLLTATDGVEEFSIFPNSLRVLYIAELTTSVTNEENLYTTYISEENTASLTEDFPSEIGSQVSNSDILSFQISPDGSTVVFNTINSISETSNSHSIHSVSANGGEITQLDSSVNRDKYAISNNSETIVFISDREESGVDRLYSTPITGGTITTLSPDDSDDEDNDVSSFEIAADDSVVVFAGDLETDEKYELYSEPLAGGDVTKISQAGDVTYDLEDFVDVTDGGSAVFYGTAEGETTADLYVTPMTEANVVDLTPAEYPATDNYAINTTSGLVAYESEIDGDNSYLVVVSAADLTAQEIVDDLVPGSCFSFNYDGSFVLFHEEGTGLYVVSSAGGTPTLLTNDITTDGTCAESQFVMTHDNQYVVYRSGSEVAGYELNRVSVTTGEIPVLADHDDLGIIDSFKVSDDSFYVVVEGAEEEDASANDLYSIPIAGGDLVQISE